MSSKYTFCMFIICFNTGIISSQPMFRAWNGQDPNTNLHTFSNSMGFNSLQIAEDFGPRQLDPTNSPYREYQWHGGIDYNSASGNNDLGDLLLALEGGPISKFSQMISGTKSVLIEADG